jgi:hypothetical protein
MKQGAILSQEQANELGGKSYGMSKWYIFDYAQNGDTMLPKQQIDDTDVHLAPSLAWVKDLPIVDYTPA